MPCHLMRVFAFGFWATQFMPIYSAQAYCGPILAGDPDRSYGLHDGSPLTGDVGARHRLNLKPQD